MSKKKKPTPAGPKIATSESRRFGMHPRLLMDVIQRQAGTLCKAILEGTMNGVDAKADEINITLTEKRLVIGDTGHGITDKQDIIDYWETFGQPPTEEEKKKKTFGYFRMGRGQLFAFGVNKWETAQFEMTVDIQNKGLDYDLIEHPRERTKGCLIEIALYEPILPSDIAAIERELRLAVKYAPARVTFNDKVISIDKATVKWDHELDGALVRLQDTGSLHVYNLGVLVCSHPQDTFGVGGDVLSTRQLKVNFARNEVMADCPVWRKVKPLVDQHAANRITKRASGLDDAGRQRIANAIKAGTVKDLGIDVLDSRILTDVTGRHWSINQLNRWDWSEKITAAPPGEPRGDRLHQYKLAFVLSNATLTRFGTTLDEMMQLLIPHCTLHRAESFKKLAPFAFEELAKDINDQRMIVPEEDWTSTEKFVMGVIGGNVRWLLRHVAKGGRASWDIQRRLILGASQCANGWTDGDAYIAIAREYIFKTGIDAGSWASYGSLLIHEYCHDDADFGSHLHSPEFYAKFHDWTRAALGEFVYGCLNDAPKVAERIQKSVTARQLKQQDKLAKANTAAETVLALDAAPQKQ